MSRKEAAEVCQWSRGCERQLRRHRSPPNVPWVPRGASRPGPSGIAPGVPVAERKVSSPGRNAARCVRCGPSGIKGRYSNPWTGGGASYANTARWSPSTTSPPSPGSASQDRASPRGRPSWPK